MAADRPGTFQRFGLRLSSLTGNSVAKQTLAVLPRLDTAKLRLETLEARLSAGDYKSLVQFGGADRSQAASDALETLQQSAAKARQRLESAYGDINEKNPDEADHEVRAIEQEFASWTTLPEQLSGLIEAQQVAQREAWDKFATNGPATRAAILAQQLDQLPEIPELPRPDVSGFTTPCGELVELVPDDYRTGQGETVCFDPDAVGLLIDQAVAAAPEAETRLTSHLYQAARGYEAALGPERSRQVLETLRDPAAMRDLRQQQPELFQNQPGLMGGALGGGLLPMLLMTYLFSSSGSQWETPRGTSLESPGLQAGSMPSSAEVDGWLQERGVPTGDDFQSVLDASATYDESSGPGYDYSQDSADNSASDLGSDSSDSSDA